MPRSTRPLATAAVAVALLAGACSSTSGRELRPPTTTVAAALARTPAGGIVFTSPALDDQGALPRRFANGTSLVPPLSWSAPGPTATELIVAAEVMGPDGPRPDGLRWLVLGVDPKTVGSAEGTTPVGGHVVVPWTGPAPGDPSNPTRVRFRLLVLAGAVDGAGLSPQEQLAKVDAQSVTRAEFSAPFAKAG